MRQVTLIIAALFFSITLMAQESKSAKKTKREEKRKRIDALIKQEEEGVIAYKKHIVVGAKLTSDGYGGFIEKGISKSVKKALLFQLDITEKKHQKEEKSGQTALNLAPKIYGKLNFFYPVKLGVQMQLLLGNKGSRNGVNITGNLGGGLTLGLLRPYELGVDTGSGKTTYFRYDSPDSLWYLAAMDEPTAQGPGFSKGWNHLKITPGIYVKPALRFDYGRYNETISGLEVGLIGEFYAKKIPQMLYNKQKQFFLSAYVTIIFGKRK
ncbi:MAG: hypothetical protein IPP48_13985 [Chitinophagaceae bacterium]|nr:hypothetical protein [Chitinophagaceae bacterium]